MRAVLTLTGALLRTMLRNRQGFFWTLVFPILLMVIFGLLANFKFALNLALVGPQGPETTAIARAFARNPFFHVRRLGRRQALHLVRLGQEDAAVVVPDGASPSGPLELALFYNNANLSTSQQTVAAVSSAVAQMDVAMSGRPPAVALRVRPLARSLHLSYLDLLVPGLLAFMVMQNSLFGAGAGITRWKERGILRRFLATPLRPAQFLAGFVLYQTVFIFLSLGIIFLIATQFLGAHLKLPALPMLVLFLLGVFTFLSLGFTVAGFSKTQEAAFPLLNLISFPMMFLSGVFFPISSFPKVLQVIVSYFPLTFLVDGARSLTTGLAAGFAPSVLRDLAGLAVWLVALVGLSTLVWRWE